MICSIDDLHMKRCPYGVGENGNGGIGCCVTTACAGFRWVVTPEDVAFVNRHSDDDFPVIPECGTGYCGPAGDKDLHYRQG